MIEKLILQHSYQMNKYCAHAGCREIIVAGKYCSEHNRRPIKRSYLSKNQKFYRSIGWQDLIAYVRQRDENTCQSCGRLVFGRNAQVDHIEPIWLSPEKRLDPNNCRMLCAKCHPQLEYQPQNSKERLIQLSFNPGEYF